MSESSGSVVEQAGTDAAGEAVGGLTGAFLGRGAGNYAKKRVKKLKKKIEKVKLHTIASLNGLPNTARFNLVMFSDGVQRLSPGMIRADGFSVAAVSLFVDRLEAGGSTNLYSAVEAALYSNPTHIIVLTDGMPTSSTPEDILDLVAEYNPDGEIKVSTVGVGGDQARTFLSELAEDNGGSYTMYD